MNITNVALEIASPTSLADQIDNMPVTIVRGRTRGLVLITVNGHEAEASIADEEHAWYAAADMLDRCLPNFKTSRRFTRAAFAMCTGSEIHEYADVIRRVAGV